MRVLITGREGGSAEADGVRQSGGCAGLADGIHRQSPVLGDQRTGDFPEVGVPLAALLLDEDVDVHAAVVDAMRRVVVHPDIVISAQDLGLGNPSAFARPAFARTFPLAYQNTGPAGLNGPGTLPLGTANATFLTFNKVGNVHRNRGAFFIDEASADQDFTWASFDGSTNAPVLYPSGTSIMDLEAQILQP